MSTHTADTTWPDLNYAILEHLADKPHPLVGADQTSLMARSILIQARTAHHLLDLAGIPYGTGNAPGWGGGLDARTWQAATLIGRQREWLARIAQWHTPRDDYCCNECGQRWPCDTRQMADGTHPDLTAGQENT